MISFSIIVAVRNGAATIKDCIDSIMRQNYPVELIVVDGASTDGTPDIVRKCKVECRLVSEPDNGVYDAMNKGIALATGDVIGMLNADDFYASSDVLKKVALAFSDASIDSCYGDLVYVGQSETSKIVRYWRSGRYDVRRFYRGWMPPHPTFFVRREVYERYGTFNLNLGSASDYELMLRFLLKHGISTRYIPEILVKMRVGGMSNVSLLNRLRANKMDREAWRINGLKPLSLTFLLKPLRKMVQYFRKPEPLAS